MKKQILTFVIVFFVGTMFSQKKDWRRMMQDSNANFYDVQKAANKFFSKNLKEAEEENEEAEIGYEQYKRWEAFMEPRVYPSGNLSLPSTAWSNYEKFLNENGSGNKSGNNMIASSTWTAMGPFGAMTASACGLPRKAGRDNFITFHPSVANTFWVGAPAGGLWKTTNNGASWSTNTDNLAVIGCSDLAIDPITPTTMYLGTGDGDAGDTYAIGVLKSTDGGTTWNVTGLNWAVSLQRTIRRVIVNPVNPQIVIVASSAGVFRTTNGGTSWTSVIGINAYDVEFKPTNPNVVYACGTTTFYRSADGGATWTLISNGIPTTGQSRRAIAVTANDTNYVYVLAANSAGGYGALYRSVAGGTVFTTMSTTPDIIANSCAAPSGGNQGWYDLALDASPLNKNEVVVGGVNHWRSTDGGGTWTVIGCWNSTVASPPYVHADVHEVQYTSTGTLYSCNDGGVYQYTGSAWNDLSAPRNIAQQYRIGLSGTTADYWITGHQDNGSNIFNGTTYNARQCGDGMDCFIDRTNNNNVFCSGPQGSFYLSTNAGLSWATGTTGQSGTGAWVSPWHQDPVTSTRLYAGRSQMFVSTNLGVSWTQLTATGGSGTIVDFAIAPSNNQVLYVIHNTSVFKTTNGGTSWTNVTAGISGAPTYVCIDPTDANNAWVTVSGYTAGTKVFMTTNGGTSWTNVSSNLPNLPANCIVYEPGTLDRVYVGMDVGVYYKDNSGPNWTLYNAGLPNVPISDLEISPINPGKLYAATYGRGVYKVDVVVAAAPVSSFTVAASPWCTGTNISFTDNSSNVPTSWSWSVSPAAGVTITTPTSQNPTFNFASAGSYVVSMQATNGVGVGTITNQTVTVVATPTVTVANNSQTICAGSAVTYTASGATTYAWTGGGATAINSYTPASSTVYTVTGTNGGCSSQKTASVTVNTLPTVNITGINSICNGSSTNLTASGASTYTWNTSATTAIISVTPAITTSYTVTGTAANGCKNTSTVTVTVNAIPTINVAASSSVICAGQNANLNASGASTYTWNPGALVGAAVVTTPAGNTTYTCIGTSAAGCTNTAVKTVTVNPLPTVNATTTSSNICVGQSVNLNGTGAVTYTWTPGALTGASVSFTPAVTTIYTCSASGANGCVGTAMLTVSVSACVGIDQVVNAGEFTVYPNPTSGKLNIKLAVNKNTVVAVEVLDMNGKSVLKQNLNYNSGEANQNVNISNLANGAYFLKLNVEGKEQTIRIIKD